jgi:hypothetical protein
MVDLTKKFLFLCLLCFIAREAAAQKTLVVTKIGTGTRYCYHIGDLLKLRVSDVDTLLKGRLWAMADSVITVSELRPFDISLSEVNTVYKRFAFPVKLGRYLAVGGAAFFAIIAADHLLNNEQVFTSDMYIISGSMFAGSLISFSLSEKKCRIGSRWKIRVLDVEIR